MLRASLAGLLMLAATVQAVADQRSERLRWLTEAELRAMMLDRPVAGVYPEGTPWRETIRADGRTDYVENGKAQVGRWWFDAQGFLCFKYDVTDGGGCFKYVKISTNCLEHFARPKSDEPLNDDGPEGLQHNGRLWSDDRPSTCEAEPTV